MKSYFFAFSVLLITPMSHACEKNTYVIGVEDIDYTPHYNFTASKDNSFFNLFVDWLSNKTGCNFIVKPMPIKRLFVMYKQQSGIDFIYPDNPVWRNPNDKDWQGHARIYSKALTIAISGTMVAPSNKDIHLSEFKTLSIPRGFTPAAWLPLKNKHNIKFHETLNAKSALLMVQTRRADGADVEYNVASHLIKKHNLGTMNLATNLPNLQTGFHISTFSEQQLMKNIDQLIEQNPLEIKALKVQAKLKEPIDIMVNE